jgi:primary-amine oxidase
LFRYVFAFKVRTSPLGRDKAGADHNLSHPQFDQSANFHLETRATGILSTCTILPGETSPYGTIVAPGVLATNHQHLFSVRIDPAIGKLGEGNTVVQEDSVPMAFDPDSPPEDNFYGVGYTVEKSPITTSGWADAAPEKNRVFKVRLLALR